MTFRDKQPLIKQLCEDLTFTNGTQPEVKTGSLVTITGTTENEMIKDYINGLNTDPSKSFGFHLIPILT